MKVEGTEHELKKRRGEEEMREKDGRKDHSIIIEEEGIEKICGYAGKRGDRWH